MFGSTPIYDFDVDLMEIDVKIHISTSKRRPYVMHKSHDISFHQSVMCKFLSGMYEKPSSPIPHLRLIQEQQALALP